MTDPKPHLLCLHGALGAGTQFASLKDQLGHHFEVHTPDFEGHGATPAPDRPFAIEHFAANALAYAQRSGLGPLFTFGYSMGGYVALYMAATWPDRVERIITLGTKLDWRPEVAEREAGMLDPATMQAKVPRFAEALRARHTALGLELVLERTAEMMRALAADPLLDADRFAKIAQPVRLCLGDRDGTVGLEETLAAYRALPNGELAVLPRTAHPFERVNAARIGDQIMDFAGGAIPAS